MALELLKNDEATYRQLLIEHMREQSQGPRKNRQLSHFASGADVDMLIGCSRSKNGRWDVVITDEQNNEEDVLFEIQGYVLRKSLPPITKHTKIPARVVAARQSVCITGLNAPEFGVAVDGIARIWSMLQTYLAPDATREWLPSRENGCVVVELTNRYLSNANDIGSDNIETFPSEWDPSGRLQERVSTEVFLSDNNVLYFERKAAGTNKMKTVTVPPTEIMVGHLVGVQFSACAIPTKSGYMFIPKLRSIRIMDRSVLTRIDQQSMPTAGPSAPKVNRSKRKIGYEDEEVVRASDELKRLTISKVGGDGDK